MSKETYLRFLRACLTGKLPAGEVEDILRYYTEYFEEAGQAREQAVMAELGSPEHLSRQILGERSGEGLALAGTGGYEGGEATAAGYVPARRRGLPTWAFVLILVVAAIIAGPALAGLVFGLGLAGILCVMIGLWVAVSGFGRFTLAGLLYQGGSGLIAAAVGILLLLGAILTVALTVKVIRWFRDTFVERSGAYEEGC